MLSILAIIFVIERFLATEEKNKHTQGSQKFSCSLKCIWVVTWLMGTNRKLQNWLKELQTFARNCNSLKYRASGNYLEAWIVFSWLCVILYGCFSWLAWIPSLWHILSWKDWLSVCCFDIHLKSHNWTFKCAQKHLHRMRINVKSYSHHIICKIYLILDFYCLIFSNQFNRVWSSHLNL